ncbi:protein kinase [Streptomyces fagopyri]|uniref:non-specific serine/threonine protein kinase n=1 Tax=Streptomyces fagopyri TaxID=2662397 RepID=A0A5Q0LNI7_9ACTN|nr:protein kinase [Streptomyces fagopyri]
MGGVSEVAGLLGISRQRIATLRDKGTFPDPVAEIALGPIWDLDEVEAWIGSGLRRTTAGRPSAAEARRILGNRFTLEEPPVGSGGFADVYRATDTKTGNLVAVKVLRDVENIEEEAARRFVRELRLLSEKLSHPNVIPVITHGDCTETSEIWYAMPLARGNLHDVAGQFKDNLPAIADVMRQICAGLTYVHQAKVLHRDLKPANVLRTAEGGWAISDFGLAREAERQSEALTSTLAQGLGTYVYSAPEQWKKPKDADERADVFSLGKILQHLVTGELPLSDDDIPNGPLRPVILRATARHANRYRTPSDLLNAIEKAMEADKITWQAPSDIADILTSRLAAKDADPIAVDEFLGWAQRVDADDLLAQKEVMRVLGAMSAETIQLCWQTDSAAFIAIFANFCTTVNASTFPFEYCDVIADFARRAVRTTSDATVLRLTVQTLPELGHYHNRWHVRDVLTGILQPIRDAETALVALEGIQTAVPADVAWSINDFVQRSLHPLLREGIREIKKKAPEVLAS